jgi:hypothetical protein
MRADEIKATGMPYRAPVGTRVLARGPTKSQKIAPVDARAKSFHEITR